MLHCHKGVALGSCQKGPTVDMNAFLIATMWVYTVQVAKLAIAAGAMKAVPLAVSGAFHTPLMQPAREALVEVSFALHPSPELTQLTCHLAQSRYDWHLGPIMTCIASPSCGCFDSRGCAYKLQEQLYGGLLQYECGSLPEMSWYQRSPVKVHCCCSGCAARDSHQAPDCRTSIHHDVEACLHTFLLLFMCKA